MQIISRANAKALGLSRYFTGKSCAQGHVAERLVDGGCIDCRREYDRRAETKRRHNHLRNQRYDPEVARAQRQANIENRRDIARRSARKRRSEEPSIRERDRENARRWVREHPERHQQYISDNYDARTLQIREYQRRKRQENPQLVRENLNKWRKTEKGRSSSRTHCHRRRARKLAVVNTFTTADWRTLVARSPHCHWCKKPFNSKRRRTHDHVIPLSKGGANTLENSVCACSDCNFSKQARLINPVTGQGILI